MASLGPGESARADDMVSAEAAIAQVEADLDKARAAGNDKTVRMARGEPGVAPLVSSRWPKRASADFS